MKRFVWILSVCFLSIWGLWNCSDQTEPKRLKASHEGKRLSEKNKEKNSLPDTITTDSHKNDVASKEAIKKEKPPKPFPKKWKTGLPRLDISPTSQYRYARSIIHLHSTYSHDACDGHPRVDGKKNMPCLLRLRKALCKDSIDVAFLTEHATLMGDGDAIEKMLLYQKGDEWLKKDGAIIGNRFSCASGHKVVIFPGAENALMPVGFLRHPTPLPGKTLHQTYGDTSKEGIKKFKEAGALVLMAHTEDKSLDYILANDIHAVEIYNLHAAVDPRKRGALLKIKPAELAFSSFYTFVVHPYDMPHPDLVFLAFHQRIDEYMKRWDTLLAKKMVYGTGGTDAHENIMKKLLSDGDRPDSYSRMMLWFSNHLMVKEKTVDAYREALRKGRMALVFEVLGTPETFAFYAVTTSGKRVEMGATTKEPIAFIKAEARHPFFNSKKPVESHIKLFRIDEKGSHMVLEGKESIQLDQPKAGTYRVEVEITPYHLKGLMTEDTQHYIHSFPWIHSNPIRIQQ